MAMTSNIYKGMYVLFRGEPHIVLEKLFASQGRVGAYNKTKLKSLISGKVINQTFKSSDKLEEIHVDSRTMQFLYLDGEMAVFMDPQSFEQVSLSLNIIDGGGSYLHSEAKYVMMFYEDSPISIKLPSSITLEVVKTTSAVAGNTATGATKNAKLETGLEIQVPLFIKEGERVSVNTDTGEYTAKA